MFNYFNTWKVIKMELSTLELDYSSTILASFRKSDTIFNVSVSCVRFFFTAGQQNTFSFPMLQRNSDRSRFFQKVWEIFFQNSQIFDTACGAVNNWAYVWTALKHHPESTCSTHVRGKFVARSSPIILRWECSFIFLALAACYYCTLYILCTIPEIYINFNWHSSAGKEN